MLHNTWVRESSQGPPLHLVGPHGGQVLRGTPCTHPSLVFLQEPQVGLYPSHLQIPQEGWGISVSFNWNWKRDHDVLYALPRAGEGCWDRTPVLVTPITTHHIDLSLLP